MDKDVFLQKGIEYLRLGDILQAEENFRNALKEDPNSTRAYNNLGVVLNMKGEFEEAEFFLRKGIEQNPENELAYNSLGLFLLEKNRFEEAEMCFRKIIDLNPNFSDAYNCLGVILKTKEKFDESGEMFYKAVKLNPFSPEALANLGSLLEYKGKLKGAELCYRKIVELAPNDLEIYSSLANVLIERGKYEEAKFFSHKALSIDPNLAKVLNSLGRICKFEDNCKEAFEYFKKAISLDVHLTPAYANLSEIDIEINPDKERHFYRFVYLAEIKNEFKYIPFQLNKALEIDAPMLVQRLSTLLPIEKWDKYYLFSKKIQDCIDGTVPYRQLIQTWNKEDKELDSIFLSEVIVNYYLGDYTEAFNLINNLVTSQRVSVNLFGYYYYCLLANRILYEDEDIISRATDKADNLLSLKSGVELIEKYYGGLIYCLKGDYDKAISILREIFPKFIEAGYKLVEIYGVLAKKQPQYRSSLKIDYLEERKKVINEIKLKEANSPIYQFEREVVLTNNDAKAFLNNIMPAVHYMEIQEVLADIFYKPKEINNPFIYLMRLETEERKALQIESANSWQEEINKSLDNVELEDTYAGFIHFRDPVTKLGEYIELGAKAQYFDNKENYKYPTRFNFRLYLSLNFRLYQEGKITNQDAGCINEYLYYCIDILPRDVKKGIQDYLLKTIRDHFLEVNIPYITYLMEMKELWEVIKYEGRRENIILNFDQFRSIYNNRS